MIIKHIPEDFYVKEEMELKLGRGDYSYFILEKKNIGTLEAVNLIAGKLGINQKRVGFSGYKDKKAVTEQYISIFKINKDNVGRLNLYGINLTYIGSGNERINAGDLKHNYFRIVVRYLDEKNKLENRKFKNYFDEQRFGINKNNHLIGRAIIKREFDKACNLLKLNVENNNYVGALRTIDKRKLRFYVSAYQSHLFNEVLNKLNKKIGKLPILGYLTELDNTFKRLYGKVMKEEGIGQEDFIIKQMPELSSEGAMRNAYEMAMDFKYSYEDDEIFKGKYKAILEFKLNPGTYATCFVKSLFSKGL